MTWIFVNFFSNRDVETFDVNETEYKKTNMPKQCTGFCIWKAYVRYLLKIKFPGKPLKWILKVYHPAHKKEYEAFQKDPKIVQ